MFMSAAKSASNIFAATPGFVTIPAPTMDTFEKIRALLAEQLDIDPAKITMESDIMSDFEADSLDIVDMVMTLEDEFGIEVPDDAIENLRTVGDVVEFVDSHKG